MQPNQILDHTNSAYRKRLDRPICLFNDHFMVILGGLEWANIPDICPMIAAGSDQGRKDGQN